MYGHQQQCSEAGNVNFVLQKTDSPTVWVVIVTLAPEGTERPAPRMSRSERQYSRSRSAVRRWLPSTRHCCDVCCALAGCASATVSTTSDASTSSPAAELEKGVIIAAVWACNAPRWESGLAGCKNKHWVCIDLPSCSGDICVSCVNSHTGHIASFLT